MKVLLIGGTGVISSAVVKESISRGYETYILNRGNKKVALPEEVKVLTADVNDAEAVKAALGDLTFDVVADFIIFTKEDAVRDVALFGKLAKQFVFISTAAVYDKANGRLPVTEDVAASNLNWGYSRGKIEAEHYLNDCYGYDGLPITVVRPSQIYDETFVPVGISRQGGFFPVLDRIQKGKPVIVHGDGTALWEVTFNTDLAKPLVSLFGNSHAIGETYHITANEPLTWNQITTYIAKAMGCEVKIAHISSAAICKEAPGLGERLMHDHFHNNVFDNSKIKAICPDYNPQVRFEDGIKKTIAYVMAHPERYKANEAFDAWCDEMIEKYL